MDDDEAAVLHRLISRKSTVTPMTGKLVAAGPDGFQVDVGGGRIPAQWATAYLPEINEDVAVRWIDGTPYVVGPTKPQPTQGTVTAVGGGYVTVSTLFGPLTIPYNAALAPTAGQILHLTGKYADSVMSTSPPGGTAPPAPGGGTTTHVQKFTAQDTGSWNGAWSTRQLWASNTYLAAAWYGSKIRDTIPATAAIQLVQVFISPVQIRGNDPVFALHPDLSRPGGGPSLSSPVANPIAPGWIDLPNSYGDALKAGGGMAGIGLDHGGFNILHSRDEDGDSFAIQITSIY